MAYSKKGILPAIVSCVLFLWVVNIGQPPELFGAVIETSYSNRVVPNGREPDPDLVDQEGGIWATFTGDSPIFPAFPDTSLHQVSDRVYRHFFPWDWTNPFETAFIDGDDDTTFVTAAPEPVFPFDPSVHGVPSINIMTQPANLWDPEIGIYVWGNHVNFDQRGSAWERPASMSYFDPGGSLMFCEPIGLRINGQYSRYLNQKGLRIYFDDYGSSDELEFDFFGSGPTSLRRLILRDNLIPYDWLHSNLLENIFRSLGYLGSRYSLVHVYLNEEYWGTYSLRDRIDDEFFEHTLGLDGSDYILLKDGETEHGNGQQWNEFLDSFSDEAEFESHEWFRCVDSQMDLVNYIDWLFMNIFSATTDNGFERNVFIFRVEGGKWTHLMWDEDLVFRAENLSSNHFRFFSAEDQSEFEEFHPPVGYWEWSPRYQKYCTMFNRLMRNSEFKSLFSHRVDELLDGPLSVDGWLSALAELSDNQESEVPLHAERWNWWSVQYYSNVANNITNWIEDRHPVVENQKQEFAKCLLSRIIFLINFSSPPSHHNSWLCPPKLRLTPVTFS